MSKLSSTLLDIHGARPLFTFNRIKDLTPPRWVVDFGRLLALPQAIVFKISTVDTPHERTLLVEGKLIPPWTAELQRVSQEATDRLEGRKLTIDLSNVTLISDEGENTLFELMKGGAKFSCGGVLTKHILKRLARRSRSRFRDILATVASKSEA